MAASEASVGIGTKNNCPIFSSMLKELKTLSIQVFFSGWASVLTDTKQISKKYKKTFFAISTLGFEMDNYPRNFMRGSKL
jgi:hypothetical protein